ncbi:MAG: SDR family NAD(P)-dependent oxidoreductase [Actinomycetales bacterium]|jgi:NAD(P)-dependent dehydrogenase (short-subunit alcohol dehydrogenase family)|nr:SDR family NAD(P)-dependent oxidoreductase [Actinomycetales bacterium]
MARVFVTGSTAGIGREIARQLLEAGHEVVGHARSPERADQVRAVLPGLADVVVGDLSSLTQTRAVAEAAVATGPFDAVVHNAGVGGGSPEKMITADGLERIHQINTVAPYLLTALMPRPRRLVFTTSGLQANGYAEPDEIEWPWDGMQAYADSKLQDLMIALAVARLWPDVVANAVDPGWIRTRLGGPNATDDVAAGADTQVWLATSDDPDALVSGRFLKRRTELEPNPQALDVELQDRLLARLAEETGTPLPR